ncbi:hypothetical protein CS063_13685 [Sporanaerobium hydrogeniformans]|uniref:Uncharacterized protein n=1 Tax=Sporanaerobium hydrogeniformans TaxID=3072179 RepID=A0AC61D9F6_9FIRM|nr:hypothetical protein [Sporanaerobium hydrogeniformans]PHV69884.1 hypothetical protein CS063_13685 [Sporanaerobium hydrogeniformans]
MEENVLVCITIQENSRRLISEGARVAQSVDAPLHILHIRKGETIFDNPESSNLLQDLFGYGSELGGEVHFLCSHHIIDTIINFIKENHITQLVLGEVPHLHTETTSLGVYEKVLESLPHVHITVLAREEITLNATI